MHIPPYENANRPIVDVDNELVPLNYFNIVKLKRGATFDYRVPGYETCVVPATGTVDVQTGGHTYEGIGQRIVDVWDGEPEAVSEIKKGNSPYRISISLASPVFGYAMGQHAADWLEGKSIPQAMDILPSPLTAANIAQYEADLANPGRVYTDPARRAAYLKMYGNICYDSRDQYLNFPWSSERK
jgi:hypothetical protein